ncbi:MAG: cysteine desulfurase [Deltaproteobacteria bacterium]|nr:MAG: cysteine desulfurase [Deltaproteobacteria bacterium]
MQVYLDNNATTAPAPEVVETMRRVLAEVPGNPSSIHRPGRAARRILDEARESVAQCLGCQPREVVFTGGGSESDTLALVGSFLALRDRGKHIVVTAVEHSAVLAAARWCKEKLGAELSAVPPRPDGTIDPAAVVEALREDTVLVSVMMANNETGVLLPIREIGEVCRQRGIRFHTDAVQALGKVPIDFGALPVDLLSASAHKFHGPKGAGLLLVRSGMRLEPLIVGGGQERGLRAGTEDTAHVAGLAKAVELATDGLRSGVMERVAALRDALEEALHARIEGLAVNGPEARALRVPNTLNISIPGAEAEALLIGLDREGIYCSSGSACSSGSIEPSHVLRAMGLPADRLQSSLRLSLSRYTRPEEIEYVAEVLPAVAARVRAL